MKKSGAFSGQISDVPAMIKTSDYIIQSAGWFDESTAICRIDCYIFSNSATYKATIPSVGTAVVNNPISWWKYTGVSV